MINKYSTFLPIFLIIHSFSSFAESNIAVNQKIVTKLINHFLPVISADKKYNYKVGDFNGDGLEDIVVLFTPKAKPAANKQIQVLTPWIYSTTKKTAKYRRSLVIFQKSKNNWISDDTKVYALLDTNGVLETPSFQLLTINNKDKDYSSHASMLPIKTKNDLIILPTEAGIDTYIYWDKDTYKLFEPEEIP